MSDGNGQVGGNGHMGESLKRWTASHPKSVPGLPGCCYSVSDVGKKGTVAVISSHEDQEGLLALHETLVGKRNLRVGSIEESTDPPSKHFEVVMPGFSAKNLTDIIRQAGFSAIKRAETAVHPKENGNGDHSVTHPGRRL